MLFFSKAFYGLNQLVRSLCWVVYFTESTGFSQFYWLEQFLAQVEIDSGVVVSRCLGFCHHCCDSSASCALTVSVAIGWASLSAETAKTVMMYQKLPLNLSDWLHLLLARLPSLLDLKAEPSWNEASPSYSTSYFRLVSYLALVQVSSPMIIMTGLLAVATFIYSGWVGRFSKLWAANPLFCSARWLSASSWIILARPFSEFGCQKPSAIGSAFCLGVWHLNVHCELQSTETSCHPNSANYHSGHCPPCRLLAFRSHSGHTQRKILACTSASAAWLVRCRQLRCSPARWEFLTRSWWIHFGFHVHHLARHLTLHLCLSQNFTADLPNCWVRLHQILCLGPVSVLQEPTASSRHPQSSQVALGERSAYYGWYCRSEKSFSNLNGLVVGFRLSCRTQRSCYCCCRSDLGRIGFVTGAPSQGSLDLSGRKWTFVAAWIVYWCFLEDVRLVCFLVIAGLIDGMCPLTLSLNYLFDY